MNDLFDEKTVLAILIDEKMNYITAEKVFKYLPSRMILDRTIKKLYEMYQELAKEDYELIGTKHFVHKLKTMAEIEIPNFNKLFFEDIKNYWCPTPTVFNWIKKIQTRYFTEKYKSISCREEAIKVMQEEADFSIVRDMTPLEEDLDIDLKDYDKAEKSAVFTGYKSVDSIIGSLQGGDMVVLAGSSGSGKTCFMLNLAISIAKQEKRVDIFSLEMPKKQLQQRIICAETKIDASKFRAFTLTPEDREKYRKYSYKKLKELGIRIFKQQTVTIDDIKRIEAGSDADIVFIDYLGLINSYNNKSSYEKFSDISRELKLTAMACNKPFIVLHQLNRDYQKREGADKKPKTSDLRDSGKIEQDADMIWFVYRPYFFDPKSYLKQDFIFFCAKNRHGEADKEAKMIFNGIFQQIKENPEEIVYSA